MKREVEGISKDMYVHEAFGNTYSTHKQNQVYLGWEKRDTFPSTLKEECTPKASHTLLGCPSRQRELIEGRLAGGVTQQEGICGLWQPALAPFCRVSVTSFLTPENRSCTEPPKSPTAVRWITKRKHICMIAPPCE